MTNHIISHHDYYVYALDRLNGEVFYIGYGRRNRWRQHENKAVRGENSYKANIIRGILRLNRPVPKRKIAENLTRAAAISLEIYLIAKIGRMPFGPLANATPGGEGMPGPKSAEHKAKIGAGNRGKKRTPEQINALSERMRGQSPSQAQREKIREALKGRKQPREVIEHRASIIRGRKRTPEQRARMSAASKKRGSPSEETRAKLSKANRGQQRTAATRAKMREAQKRRPPIGDDQISRLRDMAIAQRGTTRPPEIKLRIAKTMRNIRAMQRLARAQKT
jgi:hypothetical protein